MGKRQIKASDETKATKSNPPIIKIDTAPVACLGGLMSEEAPEQPFAAWLYGTTPLICHAWSEKAKRDMLGAQVGATRTAKEKRDPEADFVNSLYSMGKEDEYGFPVTAIKKAILAVAHKDRGIPRTDVMVGLWCDAEVVSVRPALAGARCDMPLVRIYGSKPEMREDMVRVGSGLRKVATLAYRATFVVWAIRITGTVNPLMVPAHALAFLTRQAGKGIGIGDWRNEKGGVFGSFKLADVVEQEAWEKFAAGRGPMPMPAYAVAAAAAASKKQARMNKRKA